MPFFHVNRISKKPNIKNASFVNVFPLGPGNFWKAYYHVPFGGPGSYEKGVDSFYVSTDTVGLNTISNNNNVADTSWLVYNIIKVKRTRKNFFDLNVYNEPVKNYGIVRVDTSLLTVYTAVPVCTCWHLPVVLPNYTYFNEILLFDYNLQTNDTAFIYSAGDPYNTTAVVDSFVHNGHVIKRQYFYDVLNPGDSVGGRMQFGCILNTNEYITGVIDNISLEPNAILDSLYFFYNINDSVLIKRDTYNIP